jgi:hypothetical protein
MHQKVLFSSYTIFVLCFRLISTVFVNPQQLVDLLEPGVARLLRLCVLHRLGQRFQGRLGKGEAGKASQGRRDDKGCPGNVPEKLRIMNSLSVINGKWSLQENS